LAGRLWTLDDADTDAVTYALSQVEGKRAPAADVLGDQFTRSNGEPRFNVDIDDDARLVALYAALIATGRAGTRSETVTKLRHAIGQRLRIASR
jgi:hypothetical protein